MTSRTGCLPTSARVLVCQTSRVCGAALAAANKLEEQRQQYEEQVGTPAAANWVLLYVTHWLAGCRVSLVCLGCCLRAAPAT